MNLGQDMELMYIAYILLMWYALRVVTFIWKFILQFIVPFFGYTHDLRKYGEWAIVIGCTDGIGLQYALQLAAKGFDIVIMLCSYVMLCSSYYVLGVKDVAE